jgi:hypothetical protein
MKKKSKKKAMIHIFLVNNTYYNLKHVKHCCNELLYFVEINDFVLKPQIVPLNEIKFSLSISKVCKSSGSINFSFGQLIVNMDKNKFYQYHETFKY